MWMKNCLAAANHMIEANVCNGIKLRRWKLPLIDVRHRDLLVLSVPFCVTPTHTHTHTHTHSLTPTQSHTHTHTHTHVHIRGATGH